MATHKGPEYVAEIIDWMDLPDSVAAEYDWAEEGTQFVEYETMSGTTAASKKEYIPLENFQRVSGAKSPSGLDCTGFATDSYSSGTAILINNDGTVKVWRESW